VIARKDPPLCTYLARAWERNLTFRLKHGYRGPGLAQDLLWALEPPYDLKRLLISKLGLPPSRSLPEPGNPLDREAQCMLWPRGTSR
jgi:hypothetical protein